jgi:Sec-independent protein secretion pathway component TatC
MLDTAISFMIGVAIGHFIVVPILLKMFPPKEDE